MTAGGSQIIINGKGVFISTSGIFEVHAAQHIVEGGASAYVSYPVLPGNAKRPTSHQFMVNDSRGLPSPGTDYLILDKNGQAYKGKTDAEGLTQRVHAVDPKHLRVFYDIEAHEKARELGLDK